MPNPSSDGAYCYQIGIVLALIGNQNIGKLVHRCVSNLKSGIRLRHQAFHAEAQYDNVYLSGHKLGGHYCQVQRNRDRPKGSVNSAFCDVHTCITHHNIYHIVGYFRGENISRMPSVHEENFHECMAVTNIATLTSAISQGKFS